MRLTKRQLKKIIREEAMLLREGHTELEMSKVFDDIDNKMQHELLYGIQGRIQQAYEDPSADGVDLGALADDMGFLNLMEQVAAWFEAYIDECETRYINQ